MLSIFSRRKPGLLASGELDPERSSSNSENPSLQSTYKKSPSSFPAKESWYHHSLQHHTNNGCRVLMMLMEGGQNLYLPGFLSFFTCCSNQCDYLASPPTIDSMYSPRFDSILWMCAPHFHNERSLVQWSVVLMENERKWNANTTRIFLCWWSSSNLVFSLSPWSQTPRARMSCANAVLYVRNHPGCSLLRCSQSSQHHYNNVDNGLSRSDKSQ